MESQRTTICNRMKNVMIYAPVMVTNSIDEKRKTESNIYLFTYICMKVIMLPKVLMSCNFITGYKCLLYVDFIAPDKSFVFLYQPKKNTDFFSYFIKKHVLWVLMRTQNTFLLYRNKKNAIGILSLTWSHEFYLLFIFMFIENLFSLL